MRIVPPAAAAALLAGCSAQAEPTPSEQASSEGAQPTQFEGAGPVTLVFVVDPDFVGVVIESPMANYGVASNLAIPPENHGVPEFDDYNDLRDELSRAIADEIDDIEPSIGSKFAFNQTAGCSYDEGSESIVKRDGQWMVTFDIEFACRQPANLQDVSINLFDMGGFSSGTAKVVNGDIEASFEIDGINRKVDLN
ncbi:hypothetical protein ACRAQ7_04835 [Erythrobacter sp. W53]|uniref:hypothetical protein n=1 Tax=Erythrobacter sp. W53 TaxID=3425947 RepID=UPI003D7693A9